MSLKNKMVLLLVIFQFQISFFNFFVFAEDTNTVENTTTNIETTEQDNNTNSDNFNSNQSDTNDKQTDNTDNIINSEQGKKELPNINSETNNPDTINNSKNIDNTTTGTNLITTDNETDQKETTNKNDNDLIEILNKRKEELKKVLEKSEAEKQVEEEKRKKRLLEIQKEIIKELNQSLEKEIEGIKQSIDKNKNIIDELKKEKTKNISLENKLKKLEKENSEYQKKIKLLQQTIDNNNKKIYDLQIALNNQDLLLQKAVELKTELEKQKDEQLKKKIEQVLFVGGILLLLYFLFAIIEYIYIKKSLSKKREIADTLLSKLTGTRTIISLIFVIYFIISLFYIFPQYVFILFFALSALLVITSPIIGSYISTILLIGKINIGDRIIFPKTKNLDGIVTNIGLLSLEIRKIADNRITNENISITTRQLFLEPYVHIPHFVDFKSIKLGKIKEGTIIENKELQNINIVTKLKNEYLSKFIEEVKQILNKNVVDRIDNKHHYLMEFKIKDLDTMNIDVKIKADIDTTNKIRLKIFNTMFKYEKMQEKELKDKEEKNKKDQE